MIKVYRKPYMFDGSWLAISVVAEDRSKRIQFDVQTDTEADALLAALSHVYMIRETVDARRTRDD